MTARTHSVTTSALLDWNGHKYSHQPRARSIGAMTNGGMVCLLDALEELGIVDIDGSKKRYGGGSSLYVYSWRTNMHAVETHHHGASG
jgi:hypothetical protein